MTDRELMQQALEALRSVQDHRPNDETNNAIAALRKRLVQPEQEPFGYFQYSMHLDAWVQNKEEIKGIAFYTTPPQRKPLTKEELLYVYNQLPNWGMDMDNISQDLLAFARGIEAAHNIGEKK